MQNLINNCKHEVKIITPNDGYHYFFAYYDMRATGEDGRHLCHRVPFMDRLPVAEDVAEVGYLEDGKFYHIGETTAWNFQQGAMLQYHPFEKNTVYYNVCEDGKFQTVTHNFETGEKKYADRATACVSPDGKWGLAVNFGRIYDFRPGYGYAGFKDEYSEVNAPHEDGVFLVDMEKGTSKQILFYDTLAPISGFNKEDKVLVNHITFNTASDRFVMLVRNFQRHGSNMGWSTSMVVSDIEGNAHTVLPNTYVSHYHWLNAEQIVAHCTVEGDKKGMYLVNTTDGTWIEYDMPYFHEEGNTDIHCNFSPDGRYIIGDGYPHAENQHRYLLAYDVKTGKSCTLLSAKTDFPVTNDIRCDLHARFVWGGKYISFDTTHNDRREIALISSEVLKEEL